VVPEAVIGSISNWIEPKFCHMFIAFHMDMGRLVISLLKNKKA
jgi:hypothetical protein